MVIFSGCSTKKNTQTTRWYHEINTRYNIYFNAEQDYNEKLEAKIKGYDDNLSLMLDVFPSPDYDIIKEQTGGPFDVTVDKTTKAIKLHSIKAKPQRDPSKRKDVEYQNWLKQQEYNPFLKNAWLLLGKAEYQNNDFLQSISTLSYITRLYRTDKAVVAEARIWIAKGYTAMGWFYEAEDTFHKIQISGGVPSDLQSEFDAVYVDYLVKRKDYVTAIPYLEQAIKGEKNGTQRIRLKYLLGQLYAQQGNSIKAYEAFDQVMGLNTPYLYTFNAKIQQASLASDGNRQKILDQLNKMSRGVKNKEYLDQIYFAIGNIYLNQNDTVKAVENYKKGVEKSTRSGYDKAINQVQLGDIYFAQRDYVKAQPCYSDALSGLSKKHEEYPRVALRSAVLDELVVYVKAVHLQDSLQTLARMPEDERLRAIDKIITDLKKADDEERKSIERENYVSDGFNPNESLFKDNNTSNTPVRPTIPSGFGSTDFYFYNKELVESGKVTFKQKWGTRKLEDNWRRRNKQVSLLAEDRGDSQRDNNNESSEQQSEGTPDKYTRQFYLQQLPLTDKAIAESDTIIEDGFFNMGKIYNEKLGDYSLAIEAFETDIRRFPSSPNLEEIYYQLFLINLRFGNHDQMENYRNLLLATFPKSIYAAALADTNYEYNMRNMYLLEDNLYQQTYDAYLAGRVNEVRTNYTTVQSKYPLSGLVPKFMFLNALTYAQTNNPDKFKESLKELIDKYPKADVSEVATNMLKGLLEGKELSSDTSPMRGLIWDIKLGSGDDTKETAGVDFVAKPNDDFMLIFLFRSKTVDKNQLIYDVASYNFSKFVYQTFDLSFGESNSLEMLQVRGFESLDDIVAYVDMAFEKNSLMDELDPTVIPIPISADNYIALMNGKTLNEYFLFFEKNYTKEMIPLIMYWNQQKQKAGAEPVEPVNTEAELPKEEVQQEESVPTYTRPIPKVEQKKDDKDNNISIGVENVLTDDQIEKADKIINKVQDVWNNPVEGLKGLLNSSGSSENLTKEEKAALKEERKREKEEDRRRKKLAKEQIKLEEQREYDRQDSIQAAERQIADADKAARRAIADEKRNAEKAKENARKQALQDQKDRAKARKELLKKREKARKELLKAREQERKEALEQRRKELNERKRQSK